MRHRLLVVAESTWSMLLRDRMSGGFSIERGLTGILFVPDRLSLGNWLACLCMSRSQIQFYLLLTEFVLQLRQVTLSDL